MAYPNHPRRWPSPFGGSRPRGLLLALLVLGGCGPTESGPIDLAVAPGSDDLVLAVGAQDSLLQAPADPTASTPPAIFYLDYADGGPLPNTPPDPCGKTPPKFVCDFAPTLKECQKQIQAYLDRWYANLNVVFTLSRPTSGWFYTEVVSSGGGAWCNAADRVAGIAPFLCTDLKGGVAYTFSGGRSAKDTAIIIAQEQAHLVGLEHTLSTRDIMDPTICSNCDGFENVTNQIQNDHCGRDNQNSYQMMQDRLGVWTGGVKPTPFGCQDDNFAPSIRILTPTDNATVEKSFPLSVEASDDCKVSSVSVRVMPMDLHTQSTKPPFAWTLTKISGRQTVTITAVDPSGKTSSTSIIVNAPGGSGPGATSGDTPSPEAAASSAGAGCDVVGGTVGGSASLWTLLLGSLAFSIALRATRRPTPARRRRAGSSRRGR